MSVSPPPYRPPVEVAPGVHLLAVPIRIPLRYINCYLCEGPSGWTLVDTGFHDDLAEDAWNKGFSTLGITPDQVKQILVTHYHPDHIGAAGWLQELTRAPVYIHEKELPLVELFFGQRMPEHLEDLKAQFRAEGMPNDLVEQVASHHELQWMRVQPFPTFTPLATGSQIQIGPYDCQVIWTPGHSDGLAVFFDQKQRVLIANDMLLAKITPNVSLWPNCRPDPLQDYLESLDLVEALPAKIALTGHRTVIDDVPGRCQEIRRHHQERLAIIARACQVPGGATAWEVCQKVFEPERLTIHQVRFAMSETLAHLVHLVGRGELRKKGNRYLPTQG